MSGSVKSNVDVGTLMYTTEKHGGSIYKDNTQRFFATRFFSYLLLLVMHYP